MSRLENVERNQVRLGGELERVREEVKSLKRDQPVVSLEATPVEKSEDGGYFGSQNTGKAKMKAKESDTDIEVVEIEKASGDEWQKRVEAVEAKVESILETLKIE